MIKFNPPAKQFLLIHDDGFFIEFASDLDVRQFITKQEDPQKYTYKYIEMHSFHRLEQNS